MTLLRVSSEANGITIDLKAALDAYVKQAGVPLIVASDAVKGTHTRGVTANVSAEVALARILAGTGFRTAHSAHKQASRLLGRQLVSRERVRVPPDYAAEMAAYDPTSGELRTHYAGFFDPGFGDVEGDTPGTPAVLEVRAHDVPFSLEHMATTGAPVRPRGRRGTPWSTAACGARRARSASAGCSATAGRTPASSRRATTRSSWPRCPMDCPRRRPLPRGAA